MSISVRSVAAQPLEPAAVAGAVGIALRSAGDTALCCGPHFSADEPPAALWFSGAGFRRIAPRVGIEGEVSWARTPEYVAHFQGEIDGHPLRGYRAENAIRSITVAGLVRVRAWHSAGAAFDVVGGVGWTRESRSSRLESVAFHPTLLPEPSIVTTTDDARHRIPVIIGLDLAAGRDDLAFVAQTRLHLVTGARDDVRTDLELGRAIVQLGLGVRKRF